MKKTMKRNALLSSVAMLIVSAIVLTSATYAWFTAAKQVSVNNFTVKTQSATGLVMSIDGGTNWSDTFDASNSTVASTLAGRSDNKIPGQLATVSTINCSNFVTGSVSSDKITFTDTDQGYYKINLKIKSEKATSVTLEGTTFANDPENTANTVMKLAVVSGSSIVGGIVPFDATAQTWKGIDTAATNVSASNGIADTGTQITPVTALSSISIGLQAGVVKDLVVYVWLEGNDPDCNLSNMSSIQSKDVGFSLNFKDTSAT